MIFNIQLIELLVFWNMTFKTLCIFETVYKKALFYDLFAALVTIRLKSLRLSDGISKQFFPPGLTFLASVFWTFLPYFSDPVWVLRRIQSPYLIKKLTRRGIEPGPPGWEVAILSTRPRRLADIWLRLNVSNKLWGRFPIVINVVNGHFWSRKSIQGKTEARKVKPGEKMPFLFRFL